MSDEYMVTRDRFTRLSIGLMDKWGIEQCVDERIVKLRLHTIFLLSFEIENIPIAEVRRLITEYEQLTISKD